MTTSFLDSSKNAEEDITNTPEHYHNFNGAGLRIRCYWTQPILRDRALLVSSFNTIRKADEILQKYSLKLDLLPPLAQITASARATIREKANSRIPPKVRPLMTPFVRGMTDAVIDTMIDENADRTVAAAAVLNFDGAIPIPAQGKPPIEPLQQLRRLIEPVTEETRLIVVFVPFIGLPNGYTELSPQWLPWVLIDPRHLDQRTVLLHEVGHACRLAHQQMSVISSSQEEALKYRNLMSYLNEHDRLWGWQVDTIYDSYWCTGARPTNWWQEDATLPMDHPFMWGS